MPCRRRIPDDLTLPSGPFCIGALCELHAGQKHVGRKSHVAPLDMDMEQTAARLDIGQCFDKQNFSHPVPRFFGGSTRFLFWIWSSLAVRLSTNCNKYSRFNNRLPFGAAA